VGTPTIVADGVGKRFLLHHKRATSLKERLLLHRQSSSEAFWALRDVDLEIGAGQTVGLIGPNGSGKSTLLKVLSGILAPTTGTVAVRGRIASLLELGAGFNGELTGRENVYLNAAILGLSRRETDRYFDDTHRGLRRAGTVHRRPGQTAQLGHIAPRLRRGRPRQPDILLSTRSGRRRRVVQRNVCQDRRVPAARLHHPVRHPPLDLLPRVCSRGVVATTGGAARRRRSRRRAAA
jgi:energy-coupling factor transporter ATP-binding protein EcfA2